MQAYATAEPKPPIVLSTTRGAHPPTIERVAAQPGRLSTAGGERSIYRGSFSRAGVAPSRRHR
jgi:hypothetical protein